MPEFDQNILRRNLPEDVHSLMEQVNSNVNEAVNKVVRGFKERANAAAEEFAQRKFSVELQQELSGIKSAYQQDLNELQALAQAVIDKAAKASSPGTDGEKLRAALASLTSETSTLTTRLTQFRDKVDKMAEATGGLIAKAAVKTFTGGIA